MSSHDVVARAARPFRRPGVWLEARRRLPSANKYICATAMLVCDLAACVAAFGFATLVAAGSASLDASVALNWSVAFAAVAGGLLVCLAAQAHYHGRIPFWTELQHLVLGSAGALVASGFLVFLQQTATSRTLLLSTWIVLPVLIVAFRWTARRLLTALGIWQIRVLIVGARETVPQTVSALRSEPGLGYTVADVVTLADLHGHGGLPRWRDVLRDHGAELLVLVMDRGSSAAQAAIAALVRDRVPFAMVPDNGALPVLGFQATRFFSHNTVLVTYRNNLARPVPRVTKMVFDVFVAAVLLVILAPVLLMIAAAIKLDGGPVMFRHPRLGAAGQVFGCLKFRSMVTDAPAVLQRLLSADPAAAAEWKATRKLRHDPRVTRIGRLLRKTSLDELPQLLNVLRLEMSLVGPRPIVSSEAVHYGPDIAYYYETRPGLTGLWQVSGRSTTSYAQRVQLDTWYVKNWTIWHDVAILAKTVPAVFKRRGAY